MSIFRAANDPLRSPFTEITQIGRERTMMVIAISTLGATSCLIASFLLALGGMA